MKHVLKKTWYYHGKNVKPWSFLIQKHQNALPRDMMNRWTAERADAYRKMTWKPDVNLVNDVKRWMKGDSPLCSGRFQVSSSHQRIWVTKRVSEREKLTWMEGFFSSSSSRRDHGRMCDIKNRPTPLATIFLAHMEGEESGRREGERRAILIGRRVSAHARTHTHTHARTDTHTQQCNPMMHNEKI